MAFISDLEITETGIYTPQNRWINAIVVTGPKWSSKNNRHIHHLIWAVIASFLTSKFSLFTFYGINLE